MKNVLLTWIVVTLFSVTAMAQTVNHISISPANPTATDTISIVSDFSYDGNCSYGLVYVDTFTIGSTIHVLPLYCGYGSSTLCNSIDTFRIGPYPGGSYSIQIQYHQGSVCPISGFDAIIAQFDSTLIIGGPSGFPGNIADNSSIGIYPNPANNRLTDIAFPIAMVN